ncbi:MAG: hypothetical protein K2X39_10420 [Silvanigrellaceae bacterium]|nr:hypothetical protein [Silvanigrellaceae bacterium]
MLRAFLWFFSFFLAFYLLLGNNQSSFAQNSHSYSLPQEPPAIEDAFEQKDETKEPTAKLTLHFYNEYGLYMGFAAVSAITFAYALMNPHERITLVTNLGSVIAMSSLIALLTNRQCAKTGAYICFCTLQSALATSLVGTTALATYHLTKKAYHKTAATAQSATKMLLSLCYGVGGVSELIIAEEVKQDGNNIEGKLGTSSCCCGK